MKHFNFEEGAINSRAALFAKSTSSHETGQIFVAGFGRMVNEPFRINERNTRIGDFYPVRKYLNQWSCSGNGKVLVNDGIGNEFAKGNFRIDFRGYSESASYFLVGSNLGNDKIDQSFESDGVSFSSLDFILSFHSGYPIIRDYAHTLSFDDGKILNVFCEKNRTQNANVVGSVVLPFDESVLSHLFEKPPCFCWDWLFCKSEVRIVIK